MVEVAEREQWHLAEGQAEHEDDPQERRRADATEEDDQEVENEGCEAVQEARHCAVVGSRREHGIGHYQREHPCPSRNGIQAEERQRASGAEECREREEDGRVERLEGFAGSIECTGDEREQPAFDDRRQPMEAGRQMEEE